MRRRLPMIFLGLLGLVVLVGAGGIIWLQRQIDPPGGSGRRVDVTIPNGSSTKRIGAILDDRGVISSARVFDFYVRFTGSGPFQAGDYTFRRNSSMGTVVDVLDQGPAPPPTVRLTVPEGLTLAEVAERVGRLPGRSEERFLAAVRSGRVRSSLQPEGSNDLEGLIFPDTYEFEEKEDEEDILRAMVEAFDQMATETGVAAGRENLTPYQLVILASLIEREAKVPDERPMMAQVMYNRLDRGERLGIDASVRYGLNKPRGPLTRSDLEKDTPYNTRIRAGLPPTPIAMPGRASLEAVVNPTPGDWLFYVIADESGRHNFATTLAEHNRYKAEAQAKGLI